MVRMTDWARHINSNRSIAEMERRSAPFFWLIIVAFIAISGAGCVHYIELRAECEKLSEAIAHLANGGSEAIGDDGVMVCQVKRVMGVDK